MNMPLLLCASPRRGNSLGAARLFAQGFNAALGPGKSGALEAELNPTMLSTCSVLPCVDCGACRRGRSCPLLTRDDSAALFTAFLKAPFIALAAPIYFYHLPAQLKALLDRCQQYFAWREQGLGGLEALPPRRAFVMLCAARERGEQLFNGALLSLRYALAPFNLEVASPLLLRGLDRPGDIDRHPDYPPAVRSLGAQAASLLAPPNGA